MADKENVVVGRRHKASRAPQPIPSKARPPLSSLQHTPHTSHTPLTPHKSHTSRVRRVPNFSRLHTSFQQQLEKSKQENRTVTKFKTFDLTPADKYRKRASGKRKERGGEERVGEGKGEEKEREKAKDVELQKEEKEMGEIGSDGNGGKDGQKERDMEGGVVKIVQAEVDASQKRKEEEEFEKRPDSLLAILQNQPIELQPGAVRTTDIGVLTAQSGTRGVALSPGRHIRLSVYSKGERALRKVLQKQQASGGVASVAPGNEFSRLLQRVVQSTASRMRTMSRVPREGGHGGQGGEGGESWLEDVKMRLEAKLEDEEEEASAAVAHTPPPTAISGAPSHHGPTGRTPPTPPSPAPHATSSLLPLGPSSFHCPLPLPSKACFYCEEKELCDIVEKGGGDGVRKGGGDGGRRGGDVCLENRPVCPLADMLERYYFVSMATTRSSGGYSH